MCLIPHGIWFLVVPSTAISALLAYLLVALWRVMFTTCTSVRPENIVYRSVADWHGTHGRMSASRLLYINNLGPAASRDAYSRYLTAVMIASIRLLMRFIQTTLAAANLLLMNQTLHDQLRTFCHSLQFLADRCNATFGCFHPISSTFDSRCGKSTLSY